MRVVCIRDDFMNRVEADPKVGDYATVVNSFMWGNIFIYVLKEFPQKGGYEARGFAPVSDIDETTFERNYNKELV